jgi:hypothetical protein
MGMSSCMSCLLWVSRQHFASPSQQMIAAVEVAGRGVFIASSLAASSHSLANVKLLL